LASLSSELEIAPWPRIILGAPITAVEWAAAQIAASQRINNAWTQLAE
jgi:hypothetical protein